jgi:N-succinyldiaminopimelate aminotransferase
MNRHLQRLLPYPFERLRKLLADVTPAAIEPIALHIGEPRHAPPDFVVAALRDAVAQGLDGYPAIGGLASLRETIAHWLTQRFALPAGSVDATTMVVPVSGTREALFSFALATLDPGTDALLAMPNPCYQIYEGAALLAGAEPLYMNCDARNHYVPDLDTVGSREWNRCQLLYLNTPANPTGQILDRAYLARALELAEHYDFVVASDECYSELYADEANPPPGLLEVAYAQGHHAFERCVVFHSLSKRSNVPGLRSGFVAGDASILGAYAKYRSYHGVGLPVSTQLASIAAWQDEAHVRANRERYRAKFASVVPILESAFEVAAPPATFYLWLAVGGDDERFTRELYAAANVMVLPGRYMSRPSAHGDPGAGRVRISLVASEAACVEAAQRMVGVAAHGHAQAGARL